MTSELVIHEVASGLETVLLTTDILIEAPNWHPSGGYLVVNGDGRLFCVFLDAPSLQPIDTGFATRCNNDHGISPDGMTLVISDSTEHGQSAIYTLPIGGGTPTAVTDGVPSYWHGWSPDGETLAFVAKRAVAFDIYTIPVRGGAETCLTSGFDHCDGPDYSPDGNWIWFNGERDGAVNLWRMRTDGSDLEKMTDDAKVNWFPHPSPDGALVLYLAYPEGTEGHPRGLDVHLCLMPADGGRSREIVSLHGGQGTINVPCWSPDGQRFAYMRYART